MPSSLMVKETGSRVLGTVSPNVERARPVTESLRKGQKAEAFTLFLP